MTYNKKKTLIIRESIICQKIKVINIKYEAGIGKKIPTLEQIFMQKIWKRQSF